MAMLAYFKLLVPEQFIGLVDFDFFYILSYFGLQ